MENKPKFWIAVVSKDHGMLGVSGGFIQVCHGKQAPLKRMKQHDWIIVYSPKQALDSNLRCQAFTAIGQVCDDITYQVYMTEYFRPFRRRIDFHDCHEVSLLPLISELSFIENKKSWGYPFRFGFFEITESDFTRISKHMLRDGG